MRRQNRLQIYWLAQLGGWGLFVFATIIVQKMRTPDLKGIYVVALSILIAGILLTHLFRWLVHRWGWKQVNILRTILYVVPASWILSFLFIVIITAFSNLIYQRPMGDAFFSGDFWQNTFNFSALFLLWNLIYFAVNTFENWKREEIKNLELRAAKTEIELNSFKAQMNPHFMFNSMNSIRALVDENPEKAKEAITKLSGLLRNNLTLGRRQTIPLKDELDLVEKYLALEKIRFEERLHVLMEVDKEVENKEVPPFMLQTIVENGIKHGISKSLEGGRIRIVIKEVNDHLAILISNTGILHRDESPDGIGLANTRTRLQLLYGNTASFHITSSNGEVLVELNIPIIRN